MVVIGGREGRQTQRKGVSAGGAGCCVIVLKWCIGPPSGWADGWVQQKTMLCTVYTSQTSACPPTTTQLRACVSVRVCPSLPPRLSVSHLNWSLRSLYPAIMCAFCAADWARPDRRAIIASSAAATSTSLTLGVEGEQGGGVQGAAQGQGNGRGGGQFKKHITACRA